MRVGDLDVEAVHAVVFDLQIGDAGARALARLERHQELAAVVVDRAKLVELGVETGGDHAAVANLRRGLRRDRARQELAPPRIDVERLRERSDERRVHAVRARRPIAGTRRERVAQPGEIARPRRGERDARGDALDVRGPGELVRERRGAR